MSEQKSLPRLFVVERHASFQSNFTPILEIIAHHKPWKSAYGETKEYLSLTEHQHILAEKDKRIEKLREALKKIDHYQNGVPGTYSDPVVIARAALQEETK